MIDKLRAKKRVSSLHLEMEAILNSDWYSSHSLNEKLPLKNFMGMGMLFHIVLSFNHIHCVQNPFFIQREMEVFLNSSQRNQRLSLPTSFVSSHRSQSTFAKVITKLSIFRKISRFCESLIGKNFTNRLSTSYLLRVSLCQVHCWNFNWWDFDKNGWFPRRCPVLR